MRSSSKSTDLVKVDEKKSNLPIKLNPNEIKHALELVDKDLFLKNRDDVKKFLPDILGRVLARIWIDKNFKDSFKSDPKSVLNDNGVHLPDDMILEFQKPNSDRPKIIVYEKQNKKTEAYYTYKKLEKILPHDENVRTKLKSLENLI